MERRNNEEEKKSLRQKMIALRKTIPDREGKSIQIQDHIRSSKEYQEARTIYLYMAIHAEVDMQRLILQAWIDKKMVALPRVQGDELYFHRVYHFDDLEVGSYGIKEPKADCQVMQCANPLIIVPGVAFDRYGNRMGYGAGYYDRFLARCPKAVTAAAAYETQLVEELPAQRHDYPMDMIFTEAGKLDLNGG